MATSMNNLTPDQLNIVNQIIDQGHAIDAPNIVIEALINMANAESDFNPLAANSQSSATGLFQYITSTWASSWANYVQANPDSPLANMPADQAILSPEAADRPVFLIVDGHPIHKAKRITAFVEAQNGKLALFYLPPYSPQLNPDEQVWAHVKRQVARQLVQSKDEMKRLALGALRRIQKLPALVKSFFRQPECQYAVI